MNQPRQHMSVLHVEVVVGPEHVGRDDGREAAAELLVVGPVLHVHQPLGVAVAEVGRVRGPAVHLLETRCVVKRWRDQTRVTAL